MGKNPLPSSVRLLAEFTSLALYDGGPWHFADCCLRDTLKFFYHMFLYICTSELDTFLLQLSARKSLNSLLRQIFIM